MKILDRDGRLFGKISIIDVIVIVVVAVLAATLYLKHQMPQTSGGVSTTTVVYQMRLENQPEYMLSAIQVGDQLYDLERSTNGALGDHPGYPGERGHLYGRPARRHLRPHPRPGAVQPAPDPGGARPWWGRTAPSP